VLNTTSAFITFHGKLEDETGAFYRRLASSGRYPEAEEAFLALARENGKHKEMVLRTYREVVTDAFEGGFPLFPLDEGDYRVQTGLPDDASLSDALKRAVEIEETSRKFCADAAKSTRGLMADVPQAFEWVARAKARREKELESLR
jgi:rubrerythrin